MSTVSEPIVAKFVAPLPPVGWWVWWYDHGKVNDRPAPALVTAIELHGTISLLIHRADGGRRSVRGSWYHLDPAILKVDHNERGVRGCWAFIPGTYYDTNHPEAGPLEILRAIVLQLDARLTALEPKEDINPHGDVESRICELADKGMTSVEIAEKLEITHQRVNGILRTRQKTAGA